jgi:RND superfamily putative drug exporter
MTPSIAALLGRWFWWPRRVYTHAAPAPATNSRVGVDPAATQLLAVSAINPPGGQ